MKILNYMRNSRTKEIHRLNHSSKRCGLRYIKNGYRCTKIWALFLIRFRKYNGCKHCWREKDNG